VPVRGPYCGRGVVNVASWPSRSAHAWRATSAITARFLTTLMEYGLQRWARGEEEQADKMIS
jgi:hypothetical protein